MARAGGSGSHERGGGVPVREQRLYRAAQVPRARAGRLRTLSFPLAPTLPPTPLLLPILGGEILRMVELFEKHPTKVNNYGIWLRYNSY